MPQLSFWPLHIVRFRYFCNAIVALKIEGGNFVNVCCVVDYVAVVKMGTDIKFVNYFENIRGDKLF